MLERRKAAHSARGRKEPLGTYAVRRPAWPSGAYSAWPGSKQFCSALIANARLETGDCNQLQILYNLHVRSMCSLEFGFTNSASRLSVGKRAHFDATNSIVSAVVLALRIEETFPAH